MVISQIWMINFGTRWFKKIIGGIVASRFLNSWDFVSICLSVEKLFINGKTLLRYGDL